MKYNFMGVIKQQCILNDALHQSIVQDSSGQYLMAAALNNPDEAGKWTILSSSSTLLISIFLLSFLLLTNKPL